MLDRIAPDWPSAAINEAWRAVGAGVSRYPSLLLAVSGGPDSLAMLVGLAQLREAGLLDASLGAQTIDHGLRPEAAAEAAIVGEVCAELGVKFKGTKLGRKPFARNAQDWARAERYRALAKTAEDTKSVILTAHTADDQAETLLMRAARGTGSEGLAGIRPQTRLQGAPVLRPFLSWPRADLHAVLDGTPWQPVRDPSNEDDSYTRVRFRRWLADAPTPDGARSIVDGLADTARIAGLENEALEHYAEGFFQEVGGAPYGFVDGRLALRAQPLAVQARFLRLALSSVARGQSSASNDRTLAFDLGRMVALTRRIANEPKGRWVGGGAVLDWRQDQDKERVSAYGEAGRSGFPELHVGPGEQGRWDGRFEICNWTKHRLAIRAWKPGDPQPPLDRDGLSHAILASLPVAEHDGDVVAMVGGPSKEDCRTARMAFLGVLPFEPVA
jgi:tRNA(Ile)-lysidine synthase